MKPLEQHEIYQNLSEFLKSRGIELRDGSYSQGIQKSCSVLTDAINLGQQSWERARVEVDKSLEQLRHVIHEKTAPKKSPAQTSAAPKKSKQRNSQPGSKAKSSPKQAPSAGKAKKRR